MPERAAIRTTIPGPWGPFHLAATERGVVAVAWLTTEPAFDADLAKRLARRASRTRVTSRPGDPRRIHLDAGLAALEGLLAGRPTRRAVAFDLADRPSWDRRVLEAVAAIPWGTTASYGEIARQVGAPRAARAVGGAVGRNPVSLLIPCHRVIAVGRHDRRVRRRRLGKPRGAAGDEARSAPARRGHARRRQPLDSARRQPGSPRRFDDGRRCRRPIHVRGVPQARFLPPVACPAGLDGGLRADRPGGRHLCLAGDRIDPGGRPDPHGHGDPEPRRGAPRRRLCRSSRPATDHGLDLSHPGRRGRAHRSRHRDRRDRPPGPVSPAPSQCRDQAVLRSGARQLDPRDRKRRGARGRELVPVDRVVRLDGYRVRRRRPARGHRRPARGRSSSTPRPSSSRPAASA